MVSGVGGGRFAPDRTVSRQEMAVMLKNYADLMGYGIPTHRAMPPFTDQAGISGWAQAAARALSEAGILSGSDNQFAPLNNATRAEVATMFKNFMRFVAADNDN